MKLLDKLKNALFEEEYVEVEEKPKAKSKAKPPKKEVVKKEVKKEEKPIAKRIVSTEKKEYVPNVREEEVELVEEDFEIERVADREVLTDKNDFRFPVMDEEDFKVEEPVVKQEPPKPQPQKAEKEEIKLYQSMKKETVGPYGMSKDELPKYDFKPYTKEEVKTYFKPSPIISPIYGVLDKNYTKEEIVAKKETRTSPSFVRENMDVDSVRRKAFGTLTDDIELGAHEAKEETTVVEEEDNVLLDLTEEKVAPEVKKVTVGDAEEYFEDLGLEYNVDYKDASKEKATGRRSEKNKELELDVEEETMVEQRPSFVDNIKESSPEDDDDDNLFDLIDSMYEEE